MYTCEICGKSYKAKRGLDNHKKENHPELFKLKCEICDDVFMDYAILFTHITKKHGNVEEYFNTYLVDKIKCKYDNCDKFLTYDNRFSGTYCCQQHYESQLKINAGIQNLVKCEICNSLYEDIGKLQFHFVNFHNFKPEDVKSYYDAHYKKSDEGKCLWCGVDVKFEGFSEGYKKFCYNTSCNVLWHNKNTNRLQDSINTVKDRYDKGEILAPVQKEYWIAKGHSEEESIEIVSNRQRTFTKQICIDKYGEVEGLERWKARQEKWLNSYDKNNYSQISQDLFWKIYEQVKHKFQHIYFASLHNGVKDVTCNKEYRVKTSKTFRLLDFYIKDINKCIEFDGSYWHGVVGRGNRTLDEQRDIEIVETLQCKILHIKEQDYNADANLVVEKCLKFLLENNYE